MSRFMVSLTQQWRLAEFRLLSACLLIVIAALVSTGQFTDRIDLAMQHRASGLLGADGLISSTSPIPGEYREVAQQFNLQTTSSIGFLTILHGAEDGQLVSVRAVTQDYPLRGEVVLNGGNGTLQPGTVWIASRLSAAMAIQPGDQVEIGDATLIVADVIVLEPGGEPGVFRMVPRVIMHQDDLEATNLISSLSRARYRLLVAGESQQITAYGETLKASLNSGESWHTVDTRRSEVRSITGRLAAYLNLVVMLAVILGVIAMALAAQGLWRYQSQEMALLRCLGGSTRQALTRLLGSTMVTGLVVSIFGVATGYAIQELAAIVVRVNTGFVLPASTLEPVLSGWIYGLVILLVVVSPALAGYSRLTVVQVLRASQHQRRLLLRLGYAAIIMVLVGITVIESGSFQLAIIVLLGLLAAALLFWVVSLLLIKGIYSGSAISSSSLYAAVKNLNSNLHRSAWLASAFGAGVFAITLLTVVRGDLFNAWQQSLPDRAPNLFLVNIQEQDRTAIDEYLQGQGIEPEFHYPIVRGKLSAINDVPLDELEFQGPQARNRVNHSFNLTELETMPSSNNIVAGNWFQADQPGWSIELETAEVLGLSIGDNLTLDIDGQKIRAPVQSFREVKWDSMQPNFYLIASPGLLERSVRTYITSLHVPNDNGSVSLSINRQFPSITPLDVSQILTRLRNLLRQGAMAINGVFGFTIIGAMLVLLSVLQGQRNSRMTEIALCKTLGARNDWIHRVVVLEFAMLGAVAGIVGAGIALVVGWGLSTFVFEFTYTPSWISLPISMLVSATVVCIAALLSLKPLLKVSPRRLLARTG